MSLYFFHTWTNSWKNRGGYSTSLLTVSVLVLSTFIFISRHLLHLFSVQCPIIFFSTNRRKIVHSTVKTDYKAQFLQSDKIFTRIDLAHLKGSGATWTQFTHQSLNTHSQPVSGADVPAILCEVASPPFSPQSALNGTLNKVRTAAGHTDTSAHDQVSCCAYFSQIWGSTRCLNRKYDLTGYLIIFF